MAHDHSLKTVLDRAGLLASIVCILHCSLTPILIFFIPFLGEAFQKPWIHWVLAAFVFPVGALAFYNGYGHHREKRVLIFAGLGFVCLAIGLFYESLNIEITATLTGGMLLSVAHVLNLRGCRSC